MNNILIVDDNPDILVANTCHLTEHGFEVTAADTGVKAISYLSDNRYDCIVLDILLPDIDGYALCKAARTLTDAPIIFLTCLDGLDDKVKGLMTGGDDYLTKPYSLRELTARIHALIRRGERQSEVLGAEFYVDKLNRMLHTPEKNVFLSQKEFALFMLFYENPGVVFSKNQILLEVWNERTDIGTVAVHVLKLRRKIDFAGRYVGTIQNDYGAGYCLKLPQSKSAATPETASDSI